MRGADVEKLFGHDVLSGFGGIAFAAKVRQIKLPQSCGHDMRDGLGGGDVGNVAVAAEDALFERPRAARTVLQHLHVVVGFEDEDVRMANAFEDQLGDVTKVGGKADIACTGVEDESNWILRVVREGKSLDVHIADFKACAGFEQPPVNFGFEGVRCLQGQVGLFCSICP